MKNYRKSDYALNKFSEGIVYQFSDRTLEISLEDFMRDNPGKTEADFMALKAVSDEIYLEQARLETAQGNKTFSMTGLEDAIAHPPHPWTTASLCPMTAAVSSWRWTSCSGAAG